MKRLSIGIRWTGGRGLHATRGSPCLVSWLVQGIIFAVDLIAYKSKSKNKKNYGGGGVGSSEWQGQLRETGSTSGAPSAISRFTFPRQHRPKDLTIP